MDTNQTKKKTTARENTSHINNNSNDYCEAGYRGTRSQLLWKLSHEDGKFQPRLGYIVRSCLKKLKSNEISRRQ
jgi:hypothetical protein